LRGQADRLVRSIGSYWLVVRARAVLDIANHAGAPLLAAALAFNAMFAILPALLLLSGILGWLIDDPNTRARLLSDLVSLVPPLEAAISTSLEGVVRARGGLTLVGLVGLVWGASNFYAALDEVMRRIFIGGRPRGFIDQRLRGVMVVAGLVVAVVGTTLLGGMWTAFETTVGELPGSAVLLGIAGPVTLIAFWIVAVALVYRIVPTAPPSWREAWPPAIVAGLGIGLLTNLFSLLAPYLVGGLAVFGILAAIFGAFVWLNLGFQLLVWGAAWARYRRDRMRGPVTPL
jgi:membrane protein